MSLNTNNSEFSHAVIKTLWRRGNGFSRTPSTPEVNEVETPGYLLMNEASSSSKDSVSANSIAFTTDAESPWDFKNIVFSPGALDVDFGFFLPNPLTPKGLRSPILSTGSLKDANASTGIFPSVSHCTTPVFKPAVHMEHPSNTTSWSAGSQMPDFADYGVASSLDLEYIPQIELEVSNDTGSELRQGLLCEPQIDALADKWTSCAVEGLSSNTARGQTASPSNDSAFVPDEAKTVSLCLEDMEPETANMVTSILFKSNIDLKMKMTVR
ncbi:hypothetical protein MMC12_001567 [Toensbergia leucococca]|nr:hypothetical protein [Toensbergia leucococca]